MYNLTLYIEISSRFRIIQRINKFVEVLEATLTRKDNANARVSLEDENLNDAQQTGYKTKLC